MVEADPCLQGILSVHEAPSHGTIRVLSKHLGVVPDPQSLLCHSHHLFLDILSKSLHLGSIKAHSHVFT
jgi:hypothetical protein